MSLMSKLLMSTVVATVTLSANAQPDNKQLLKYIKKAVVKNPQVKVKGVTVIESKTHEKLPGWTILLTTMDLEYQKKEIHAPEMMFIKDGLVTGHLVDLKTGNDYRDNIKPSVPASYYDDAHLLFGNKDAENKEYTIKNLETKEEKKVGRNEKCPCGSGKKFKHCHGNI